MIENNSIDDIIDIKEFAARGERPPPAKRYRIQIDREAFVVEAPSMTGRAILELAGKTPPERHKLRQKMRGGQFVPVGLDELVDFTAPGIERFTTLPCDQTDGEGAPRRQFVLPATDVAYLDSTGLQWETIVSSGQTWLLLRGFPLPVGYIAGATDVALLLPASYPDTPLDMAYFSPAVVRADGRAICSVAEEPIEGRRWQRWSRHRTAQNPWRPGIDDVATHLALVEHWLVAELGR